MGLKRFAKRLLAAAALIGVDLRKLSLSFVDLPRFIKTARRYKERYGGGSFKIKLRNLRPMLSDHRQSAGADASHYFFQDLWAARKIFSRRPVSHIDIGSRIDGFVSHLLVFMDVQVIDVRPLKNPPEGMSLVQADATSLSNFQDDSVDSISSLHAIEHFGLGRYGDAVDPEACFLALAELERILAPGGRLYLSVPIGRERLEFNAHRVFAPSTILNTLPRLELVSFSAVDDEFCFIPDACVRNFTYARMACGLFEFTKRQAVSN